MESKIRDLLETNPASLGIGKIEIVDIRKGEGNYNAIIESGNGKLVARISKPVTENNLEKEARMLDFLEEHRIENAPRKKAYLEDTPLGPVLLEEYVGEKDLEIQSLPSNRLRQIAELLARIHSIPVEDYNEFFNEDEKKEVELRQIYQDDFEKWARERFDEYIENAENPDERLERYLALQEEIIEKHSLDPKVSQTVIHGDPGSDFRVSGNRIYLLDWEFSRVGYPVHEVLYLFKRFQLNMEEQQNFLSAYRNHRNLTIPSREKELYPKTFAFNDTVWAAMRMAKAEKESEEEKFSRLFHKRLEELEKIYGDT